ncbi:MAG TPA: chemotaxis protein CheR [Rhodospirillaceae bacterium]|jgi:chemotaxis protein methyltransferase CheR|nr:protein-glutamate O-methyltransferase CheR [Alphaproteobacteria bacterium]HBH25953.1 chemotaxis protein CheR [Rhodospirillaceae bacterium]
MSDLSPADFALYRDLLLRHSGLDLKENQAYLLLSRLTPLAKRMGFAEGLPALTAAVRTGNKSTVPAIVEAMTTNETSFFRDTKPFLALTELLPSLLSNRAEGKALRIWSAACSTGQEAYSIAMTLDEALAAKPGWRYEILGTDIADEVLERARLATYSQFEVQRGLTFQRIMKYFEQDGTSWRLKANLRTPCTFKKANLLEGVTHLGTFDIIFCRNVLIYFNADTKAQVLAKLASRLSPDGILFLGAAEAVMGYSNAFTAVEGRHGVLRLKKP